MRALLAAAALALAPAPAAAGVLDPFEIVPGAGQGGRGDLVRLGAGTIEGVHVIQGGSLQCTNPAEQPPCPFSGIRRLSLNLDIGAGSSTHRGILALQFDVGWRVTLFDGYRHRGVMVTGRGLHRPPRVDIYGDLYLHGTVHRK